MSKLSIRTKEFKYRYEDYFLVDRGRTEIDSFGYQVSI